MRTAEVCKLQERKHMMKLKKEKTTMGKSFKMPVIKNQTIKNILSHPKFFRGHVRTATGRIYKTGEFEKRSDKVLGMKLP